MNRRLAKKIAETITNDQIKQMFDNAMFGITDWTQRSVVNKGMTKGVAWNIFAKDFKVDHKHHMLAKVNMIREFGAFLPDELKPIVEDKRDLPPPMHQQPIF